MVTTRRSAAIAAKSVNKVAVVSSAKLNANNVETNTKGNRNKRSVKAAKLLEINASDATLTSPDSIASSATKLQRQQRGRKAITTEKQSLEKEAGHDRSQSFGENRILFCLMDGNSDTQDDLVQARLIARPSKRNRSPYVADIWLLDDKREAIAHVPNLDMGGKCVPGSLLLVKASRDKKTGKKLGPDAVSPTYGTPKCEFITQLLFVDDAKQIETSKLEPTNTNDQTTDGSVYQQYSPNLNEIYPPVWVGAHPSLGERIAEIWLRDNIIPDDILPKIVHIQKQVTNPCGADNIRSDFCVTHADGTKRIIEVKTVVDTDYSSYAIPSPQNGNKSTSEKTNGKSSKIKARIEPKCVFTNEDIPYTRTAIFPWGKGNQKGPDGEAVVSTRAIHHVRELTRIAKGELVDTTLDKKLQQQQYKATILFVVIRGDAESFRPNHEACPSFCKYLKQANDAGVQIIAKRVSWGQKDNELGICYDDKLLPIKWPEGY